MGEIAVGPDRWRIANLSDGMSMMVTDVDNSADPTVVWPGEWLPFSHDMAIVTPLDKSDALSVTVFFTPGSTTSRAGACGCPAIGRRSDPSLDPGARYFAVLAALCGPVLFEGPGAPVPTSADIAARLDLSARAVDSHIDYLVDKFGIPVPVIRSNGWKRRALIAHVRARESIVRALRPAGLRPVAVRGANRKGRLCRTPI
jgi:hypothetical protein